MTDITTRLREPVMLRYNAEQINAERRDAADEIERLRAALREIAEDSADSGIVRVARDALPAGIRSERHD